jgi:hypothetical protein
MAKGGCSIRSSVKVRCGPSGRRGSRSLRISTQVDGSSRPRAHAASVPRGLLLGLQLFHDLRYCGAVRARQAPRDPPGRERVFMVDGSEFATGQRSIDSAKGWWPASGDHPDRRLREILDAAPRDDDSYRVFSAARFIRSTFEGDADFEQATFHISASFSEAAFRGTADFTKAAFKRDTWFRGATLPRQRVTRLYDLHRRSGLRGSRFQEPRIVRRSGLQGHHLVQSGEV